MKLVYSLEEVKNATELFIKKQKPLKWAYALELGETGDHPHSHMLLEYKDNKRRDNIKNSANNFFTKFMKHERTPYFINVKPAYNPLYYFNTYMQKEQIEFLSEGFSFEDLKNSSKNERKRVAMLSHKGIKINRSNFMEIYQEQKFQSSYTVTCSKYINEYMKFLQSKGYDVHFFFYNKKQVKDMILYLNDYEVEFFD